METELIYIDSLRIGDPVFLYELKEQEDGTFKIICNKGTLDFINKFVSKAGRIKVADGTSCYYSHIKGPAMFPWSNKIWSPTKDDKTVQKLFLDYAIESRDRYQKMTDKQNAKIESITKIMAEDGE